MICTMEQVVYCGNVEYSASLGPLPLTRINFNPSMDKLLHPLWNLGWNYLSIPRLQRLHSWSSGMDYQFHPTHFWLCDYLSRLILKLIYVSKRGPMNMATVIYLVCFVVFTNRSMLPNSFRVTLRCGYFEDYILKICTEFIARSFLQ